MVVPALMSLHKIYPKRNLPADQMRATGMLSLLAEPLKIMNVPNTDMVGMLLLRQSSILLLWNHHCLLGINVCGFPGLLLPKNVRPHQLVTIQLIVLHCYKTSQLPTKLCPHKSAQISKILTIHEHWSLRIRMIPQYFRYYWIITVNWWSMFMDFFGFP